MSHHSYLLALQVRVDGVLTFYESQFREDVVLQGAFINAIREVQDYYDTIITSCLVLIAITIIIFKLIYNTTQHNTEQNHLAYNTLYNNTILFRRDI